MSKGPDQWRQDSLLSIDRDKAVQQNLEALRTMIRPGNVPSTKPSPSQATSMSPEVKTSK